MTDPSQPARQQLEAALKPLLPSSWQLVTDEGARDDTQVVRVTLSQRTVEWLPAAGTGVHQVGFTVTVVVPDADMAAAEAALDDDLEVFLWALDAESILWTIATKGLYDNRLGYQLGVQLTTNRKAPR